ncbi:FxLD family lanthipeptide [Pseudonocardia sp. HH130630-07]|nr:FxLD family lanthipeptide [Pseudonocardia sp. HH130630-07]
MNHDVSSFSGGIGGEFDLDMKIVESGPVAAALLGNTDDGCDTRRDGDC